MQIECKPKRRNASGYALLITLGFLAVGLTLLASVTQWTSHEAAMTARNNAYNSTISAAEAATEMVIAQMDRDFVFQSVNPNLAIYHNLVPTEIQTNWPMQFEFSDGAGNANETGVTSLGAAMVTNLNSEFQGLYGLVMPYRITSQAHPINPGFSLSGTVRQDIQLASIPIFQFAIFYTLDLEINPGAPMVITGKVHSNANIYSAPPASLRFKDDVTAVGQIIAHRHPDDPTGDGNVKPVYNKKHVDKVSALTLPVGADNSPDSVHEIVKPPPPSENENSDLGRQRYYNRTDLIVETTGLGVKVKYGAWNDFVEIPPDVTNGTQTSYSFLNTDVSFFDHRENKWTTTTELDVGKLKTWMEDPNKGGMIDNLAEYRMGHHLDSVYVDDQRDLNNNSRLTAVRVVNGATLPDDGLTVATQLPLYVKGNFNLNNGDTTPGQTDTSQTKPASLVGDAITILSENWGDGDARAFNTREAVNTTVNAAFLSGIVKTQKQGNKKNYSGGVENFPRFLENWNGKTVTYNGSMVVMFESQFATSLWKYGNPVYNAPTRKWAFDVNFLDQSKLPPGTPQVRKLVRGQWQVIASSEN